MNRRRERCFPAPVVFESVSGIVRGAGTFAVALSFSALTATSALAQTPVDAPRLPAGLAAITEAGGTVGGGVVQVEAGVAVETTRGDGGASRALTGPSLLRIGLSPRGELRLANDGILGVWDGSAIGQARRTGYGDLSVGGKFVLVEEARGGLEFAVLPSLSLPIGADEFSSHGYDPSLSLSLARALPADFVVTAAAGAAWGTDGDDRRLARSASAAVAHALPGGWQGAIELYSETDGLSGTAWLVNSEFTHTLGKQAEVDLQLGHGTSAAAPTWTCVVGLVVRPTSRQGQQRSSPH